MGYSPNISIRIYGEGLDQVAKDYLSVMSAKERKAAVSAGSLAALDGIRNYYSEKGDRIWVNKSLPTHGPGRRPTQWWRLVESGWKQLKPTAKKAEFVNSTIGFAHKVTGGTIKAKRKRMLTIPVIPQAHGLTAKTFSQTIAPLFMLGHWSGKLRLCMNTNEGGIKTVFVLKRSVKQKKWPAALPTENKFLPQFAFAALGVIADHLEGDGS